MSRKVAQDRIDVCLEIMRADLWFRGVTGQELADQAGEPIHVWERAAAVASAIRRREMPDQEVQARIEARLDEIQESNGNDRVAALKLILESRGLLKQKVEHSTAQAGPELYAAALEDPGFRAYLLQTGWTPPTARSVPLLTKGESE